MVDTNNVRITTPGGSVKYINTVSDGGTEISSNSDDSSSETNSNSIINDDNNTPIKIISVGSGNAVLKGLVENNTYAIRSIVAGDNINITTDSNVLIISSTSTDTSTNIKNVGTGENLVNEITNNSYEIKTIVAGDNIKLSSDNSTLTISSTSSTSPIDLLSELKDVDITTVTPKNGDVLAYNGNEWVSLTPDWSGQTAKFPVGSTMWVPLSGTLGSDTTDTDTLYLKTITAMPSTWSVISIDNSMISINTGLSADTAFPIMLQSSVGTIMQQNSTAKMVTSTSYSPNQAIMDFDNNTGILNLYRINSQTIFCSGTETSITLYIGFYIMKDQQTNWS